MDTMILINCMDDDVYVLVDGEPCPLPRGIIPVLLSKPARPVSVTVNVIDMENRDDKSLNSDILLYTSDEALGVLDLPPYLPGVWNLVAPDALLQFPWREDFVTPAVWEYIGADDDEDADFEDGDNDDSDEEFDDDAEFDDDEDDVFGGLVLAGVTRAPLAVATPDMPVLDW